jgi:hypothetical protein
VPASILGLGASLPLAILLGPVDLPFAIGGAGAGFHADGLASGWAGVEPWPGAGPAPVKEFPAALTHLSPGTLPTLSAELGNADAVGRLAVPSAWTAAAPQIRPLAMALPVSSVEPAAAAPMEAGSSSTLSELGLAGMTGRAMAGPSGSGGSSGAAVTGAPVPTRIGNPPAPGDGDDVGHPRPRIVVTGVAAKIREITKLRDDGQLTEKDYTELKNRLLGH